MGEQGKGRMENLSGVEVEVIGAEVDIAAAFSDAVFSASALPLRDSVDYRMYELHNTHRDRLGVARLVLDERLYACAKAHATDMIIRRFYSHVNPEGERAGTRARGYGYDWTRIGENIARMASASTSADRVFLMWRNSPGHHANIKDPRFRDVGIASAVGPLMGNPRSRVWVVVFGAR